MSAPTMLAVAVVALVEGVHDVEDVAGVEPDPTDLGPGRRPVEHAEACPCFFHPPEGEAGPGRGQFRIEDDGQVHEDDLRRAHPEVVLHGGARDLNRGGVHHVA